MAVLLGSSGAGVDSANSNLTGTAFGVRLQALASGTVTTIAVKSTDPPVVQNHAALYADNAGQLTGATRLSGDITLPALTAGWHIYTVSPGVAVVSGTFYWLEFLNTLSSYSYTDNAASGGTTRDTTGQTIEQATHATTSSSFTNRFNAYADGTLASASGAATPTFNQIPFIAPVVPGG
jgi:hypothetical protein